MDIVKELEQITESDNFGNDIILKTMHERDELEKKIQMLKTISLAERVESIVNTDLFTKEGMEFLQLSCEYDQDYGGYRAEFHLLDANKEIIASYYEAFENKQVEILHNIFENLYPFDFDWANPKFKQGSADIELKPGVKEHIIEVLLNNELKQIYNQAKIQISYNKMQLELPGNNEGNIKKLKM
jgi:hypothetical protein